MKRPKEVNIALAELLKLRVQVIDKRMLQLVADYNHQIRMLELLTPADDPFHTFLRELKQIEINALKHYRERCTQMISDVEYYL